MVFVLLLVIIAGLFFGAFKIMKATVSDISKLTLGIEREAKSTAESG